MKVSIIVPVYNVALWIESCIASLKHQTCTDFELILVDDCGTDDSISIAENMLGNSCEFPVKILYHQNNRGLSAARNTGVDAAEGEFLLFVDSDDQLLPDALNLLLLKAEQTKADLVMGEIQMGGSSNGIWHIPFKKDILVGRENIIKAYLQEQWYVMVWNKLVRTDFVKRNRLYFEEELRTHEDGVWSFMTHCITERVAFVHSPTYIYNVRENSIMTNNSNLKHHQELGCLSQQIIDRIAKRYHIDSSKIYKHWQEKIKAWIYKTYVLPQNDAESGRIFYKFVRGTSPYPRLTIYHSHYLVWPESFGYWIYRHTVNHLWAYND